MKTILFISCLLTANLIYSAELFIRVNRMGIHTAVVYNQTQTNPSNIFRFFDLPGGTVNVQITDQQTGAFIYNSAVYLNSNQQIAAEIDEFGNYTIVHTSNVMPVNWYTSSYIGGMNPGMAVNGNYGTTSSTDGFSQFLIALDNEGFDSNKLTKAKKYIDKTWLTTQQIAEISKKFSFDSNRLEWTKYAYSKCSDKANYFLLKNTFSFQSNYNELENYIETQ